MQQLCQQVAAMTIWEFPPSLFMEMETNLSTVLCVLFQRMLPPLHQKRRFFWLQCEAGEQQEAQLSNTPNLKHTN